MSDNYAASILVGQQYGRLTVIGQVTRGQWKLRCLCKTIMVLRANRFRSGHVKSCGCLYNETVKVMGRHQNRERQTTHGMSGSPTYTTWKMMLQRCENPNDPNYSRYGGRGIQVCPRWHVFENFLADVGERPEGTTIDRRKNSGNYEPNNCRWATAKEQMNNTRQNVVIEFRGVRQTLAQWVETTGLSRKALDWRLKAGWDVERMLTTPIARRAA
jgi:hypothetical protein